MNLTYLVSIIFLLGCGSNPGASAGIRSSNAEVSEAKDMKFNISMVEKKNYLVGDGKDSVAFTMVGDGKIYSFYNNDETELVNNTFKANVSDNEHKKYKIYGKNGEGKKTNSFEVVVVGKVDLPLQVRSRSDVSKIKIGNGSVPFDVLYQGKKIEWNDVFTLVDLDPVVDLHLNGRSLGKLEFYLHNFKLAFTDKDGNVQNINEHKMLFEINQKYNIELIREDNISNEPVELKYRNTTDNNTEDILESGADWSKLPKGRLQIIGVLEKDYKGTQIKIETNSLKLNIYPNLGKHTLGTLEAGQLSEEFEMDIAPFKLKDDIQYLEALVVFPTNNKYRVTPLFSENVNNQNMEMKIDGFVVGSLNLGISDRLAAVEDSSEWPGLCNYKLNCYFNATIKSLCALLDPVGSNKFLKATRGLFHAIRLGKGNSVLSDNIGGEYFLRKYIDVYTSAGQGVNAFLPIIGKFEDAPELITSLFNVWMEAEMNEGNKVLQEQLVTEIYKTDIGEIASIDTGYKYFRVEIRNSDDENDNQAVKISDLMKWYFEGKKGYTSGDDVEFGLRVLENYSTYFDQKDSEFQQAFGGLAKNYFDDDVNKELFYNQPRDQEISEHLINILSGDVEKPAGFSHYLNAWRYFIREKENSNIVYGFDMPILKREAGFGYGLDKDGKIYKYGMDDFHWEEKGPANINKDRLDERIRPNHLPEVKIVDKKTYINMPNESIKRRWYKLGEVTGSAVSRTEQIEYEGRNMEVTTSYYEKVKGLNVAVKPIGEPNDFLILNLKRFYQSYTSDQLKNMSNEEQEKGLKKIDREVILEDHLEVPFGDNIVKYELKAITNHLGGHYTAHVKSGSVWSVHDDSRVQNSVNMVGSPNKDAYVLFYKKVN